MTRNIEPALGLIKEFEGLSLRPYLDIAGIPTIGIGTTVYPDGRKVTLKDPAITEAQAWNYLRHHVSKDVERIEAFIKDRKLTISDKQFCSLVCFAYNLGVGPIIDSKRTLSQSLISGKPSDIQSAFLMYVKAAVNGKLVTSNGLLRRRKAEIKLYFS